MGGAAGACAGDRDCGQALAVRALRSTIDGTPRQTANTRWMAHLGEGSRRGAQRVARILLCALRSAHLCGCDRGVEAAGPAHVLPKKRAGGALLHALGAERAARTRAARR